jgi:uncharacterized membrane protein
MGLYILVLIVGLLVAATEGVGAGLFAAVAVYLLGTLLDMKGRLAMLEEQLQRMQAARAGPQPAAEQESQPQAAPHAQPNIEPEPHAQAPRPVDQVAGDEEPLDLDVDFEQDFSKPASSPKAGPEPVEAPPSQAKSPLSQPKPSPAMLALSPLHSYLQAFFTRGNLIAKVGVIVLFFGVAFLLKYAAEQGLFPIELRLAGVALGGIVMLLLGWRLRQRQPPFALALQGGAVGVLYLTVFAALRLYAVIPAGLAFGLLLLFVALSALLALLQDSRALSVLGSAGGFLAPILTSTGEGSHVALFSYYLLLNGGILTIAWFKAWRVLNLLGFLFTFVIGTLWGVDYYQVKYFASTEPFLLAFFLLYVAIAVLFALRQPPDLKGLVDGSLVFGVPLVTAALQTALVKDIPYGLAYSALGFGAFYLGLAGLLFKRGGAPLRMLTEAFLATGIVFTTLAVPFAFEGQVTAAFWSLEGAAMLWVGIRQSRLSARLFGSLLQLAAGIFYLADAYRVAESLPVLNGLYLGALLIAIAGSFSSFFLDREQSAIRRPERLLAPLFFIWGFAWWLGGGVREIGDFSSGSGQWAWLLALFAATAVVSEWLRLQLPWPRLRFAALSLLPLLILQALVMGLAEPHPLFGWAALGWPLAFAAHYWLLRRYDADTGAWLRFWHAIGFWLIVYLLTIEVAWRLDRLIAGADIWPAIAWGMVPLALVVGVLTLGKRISWPVQRFAQLYSTFILAPIILYLFVWGLLMNAVSAGDPAPLSYLPILNPLDLAILATLILCLQWWRVAGAWLRQKGIAWIHYSFLVGLSLFLWLNGAVARTVHHWSGVPFQPHAMFESQVFQTAVAVLWALLGLAGMLLGSWLRRRFLWQLGAVLMALVVLKLFLVDLSNTDTMARIVSFIGVGLLLLIVGYFAPVPPRVNKGEDKG